jgi:hypothetical protein
MKEGHGQDGKMLAHALAKRAGNGASGDPAMALILSLVVRRHPAAIGPARSRIARAELIIGEC